VAGDAALLVDPDAESLATAIETMAGDQELRSRLAARGPIQAAHFTWQRTAELTVASYRKALT
jgi:alpha-1,3-rhamnosyl/mannosyltransferase